MDSSSILQNVHKGESVILNVNSLSFQIIIQFKNLYWKALNFVSKVTLNGKE